MTDSPDDKEVIQSILLGNRELFAVLVERYESYVRGIAGRYSMGNSVDDIAQEAFLEAYRHLKSFRFESSFKTWLRTIVIRRCYRSLQKSKKLGDREVLAPKIDTEYQDWLDVVGSGEAFKRYSEKENLEHARRTLAAVLAQLPADERLLMVLIYIEGHSIRDVAEVLGWSETKVKVRAHRAKPRMRKILETMVGTAEE